MIAHNYRKRPKMEKKFERLHQMACHETEEEKRVLGQDTEIGIFFLKRHILHVLQIKSYECSFNIGKGITIAPRILSRTKKIWGKA